MKPTLLPVSVSLWICIYGNQLDISREITYYSVKIAKNSALREKNSLMQKKIFFFKAAAV